MFKRHCVRSFFLFVATFISAATIIVANNIAIAGILNITENTVPAPLLTVPYQTDTVTNTTSIRTTTLPTTTLPAATFFPPTEAVSKSVPTLLDTIIESASDMDSTEVVESGAALDEVASIDSTLTDAAYADAIDGTVVANRTSASVTFFVEGELYRLAPLRSLGIQLRRNPAPLNMFNCDADAPENESTCFWDPYLVEADGFYEVFNKLQEGAPTQLVLQSAGTPPSDRIWIQNRSGQRETLIFNNELYELPPATVREFEVEESTEVSFYRRSCITIDSDSACEWIPQEIKPGFYYALSEDTNIGRIANSQISTADLQPIVAQDSQNNQDVEVSQVDTDSNVIEQPRPIACQVQVDKLNVRSGPGLNYLIVTSILSDGSASTNRGRVSVIGRDSSNQWIAVDQSVALGGWVNSSNQLIVCDGDIATLPVTDVTDGRLAPTPVPLPTATLIPTAVPAPVVVTAPPVRPPPTAVAESTSSEPQVDEPEKIVPTDVEIPAGQIQLIVQNVFEHEVRFTLSPDEYDLQPGETISIIRGAGRFTFSVSSPWRGLSGNAELTLEPDQSFSMFLYFLPKPGANDEWEMKYQ